MRCYHGTTKKGLNAILSGEGIKPNSPWTCSDKDGAMYVWPEYKIEEVFKLEGEKSMVMHAFESAEVQAVTSGEVDIFCIILDIPDRLLKDDHSCEVMSDISSYIGVEELSLDMIVSIKTFKLNKWHAPFVVSDLLSNPYFNTYSIEPYLLEAAQMLSESGNSIDTTNFNEYTDYCY